MARVNGRLPGKNLVGPSCRGGQKCCRIPLESKRGTKRNELREELDLAAAEVDETPTTDQYAYEHWNAPEDETWNLTDDLDVRQVKYIPAPKDDSGW